MTYNVFSGTLNPTHSHTADWLRFNSAALQWVESITGASNEKNVT